MTLQAQPYHLQLTTVFGWVMYGKNFTMTHQLKRKAIHGTVWPVYTARIGLALGTVCVCIPMHNPDPSHSPNPSQRVVVDTQINLA